MAKRSKAPTTSITTPPWVWGPSEGYQWAKIAYTGEGRGGKKEEKRTGEETMSNPHVYVELDTKKNVLLPEGELQKLLAEGLDLEKTCEGFDIIVTAEKFLRALAYIKIKNVTEIKIDREIVYSHPEKKKDVRETIEMLIEFGDRWKRSKLVRITAIGDRDYKVIIKIKRIHRRVEHAIDVQFNGEIEKRLFKQFVNYLKKNLEVKEVI